MFRCSLSGKVSLPGESPVRIVTKTRPKTYINEKVIYENDKKKTIEILSDGWEIVEEKLVLRETAEALNNGQEKIAQTDRVLKGRSQTFKRRSEET